MKNWWQKSVVYEIYVRSFKDTNHDGIGDINGITEQLDYLATLGVDVLWITPIYESPNDDNGYDISDYYEIMQCFGNMTDFENLLTQAHKRNIKIVMDLVVNHTSDEHRWFIESKKSKDNPYRDYYIWKDGKEDGSVPNNWTSCFLGSAWQYDETTKQYYLHLFSKKQPDLNWDNTDVRNEIQKMIAWWLDKGIDGFRMDVINLISKDQDNIYQDSPIKGHSVSANGPRVHEYIRELTDNVFSKYDVMTVGEAPAVTTKEAIQYASNDGKEMSMVFQFELMDVDGGEKQKWSDERFKLTDVKAILRKWQIDMHGRAWNSLFWNNHDQPRVVSRFGDTSSKETWEKSAKMLATAQYFLQGTPYIYQGEELGMTNIRFEDIDDYKDIESLNMYKDRLSKGYTHEEIMESIYAKGRDNGRTPMQWDNSENAGFTTGTPWIAVNKNYNEINAKQCLEDENSVFHHYRKLIDIRKNNDTIIYGDYTLLCPEDKNIFAYTRELNGDKILVVCNFYDKEVTFSFDGYFNHADILLSNYKDSSTLIERLSLRPYEAIMFRVK